MSFPCYARIIEAVADARTAMLHLKDKAKITNGSVPHNLISEFNDLVRDLDAAVQLDANPSTDPMRFAEHMNTSVCRLDKFLRDNSNVVVNASLKLLGTETLASSEADEIFENGEIDADPAVSNSAIKSQGQIKKLAEMFPGCAESSLCEDAGDRAYERRVHDFRMQAHRDWAADVNSGLYHRVNAADDLHIPPTFDDINETLVRVDDAHGRRAAGAAMSAIAALERGQRSVVGQNARAEAIALSNAAIPDTTELLTLSNRSAFPIAGVVKLSYPQTMTDSFNGDTGAITNSGSVVYKYTLAGGAPIDVQATLTRRIAFPVTIPANSDFKLWTSGASPAAQVTLGGTPLHIRAVRLDFLHPSYTIAAGLQHADIVDVVTGSTSEILRQFLINDDTWGAGQKTMRDLSDWMQYKVSQGVPHMAYGVFPTASAYAVSDGVGGNIQISEPDAIFSMAWWVSLKEAYPEAELRPVFERFLERVNIATSLMADDFNYLRRKFR